jgi:ketosteroid isomerase-like protein
MRDDTYVTLAALEHDWGHAWTTRNATLCQQLMADDFLEVSALGRLTSRAEWIAAMQGNPPRQLHWADVRVRPAGRCAIVHGLLRLLGHAKGHDLRQSFVATDVWLWRSGTWQVVSRQLTASHAHVPADPVFASAHHLQEQH